MEKGGYKHQLQPRDQLQRVTEMKMAIVMRFSYYFVMNRSVCVCVHACVMSLFSPFSYTLIM